MITKGGTQVRGIFVWNCGLGSTFEHNGQLYLDKGAAGAGEIAKINLAAISVGELRKTAVPNRRTSDLHIELASPAAIYKNEGLGPRVSIEQAELMKAILPSGRDGLVCASDGDDCRSITMSLIGITDGDDNRFDPIEKGRWSCVVDLGDRWALHQYNAQFVTPVVLGAYED